VTSSGGRGRCEGGGGGADENRRGKLKTLLLTGFGFAGDETPANAPMAHSCTSGGMRDKATLRVGWAELSRRRVANRRRATGSNPASVFMIIIISVGVGLCLSEGGKGRKEGRDLLRVLVSRTLEASSVAAVSSPLSNRAIDCLT